MLSFNPSEGASLNTSESHPDIMIELYSSLRTLVTYVLSPVVLSKFHSDTPNYAPSLQPSSSPSLEESATPSILMVDRPSFGIIRYSN